MAPTTKDNLNGSTAPIGYWGPPTSTLDWCEKNYEATYYAAEFWNTVSNLAMIVPALHGIYDSYKQGLEFRYLLCFGLFLMVGIGSWMFHMTLLYEMQLLDELPMVWGASYIYYCLHKADLSKQAGDRDRVGTYMFVYSLVVSVAYLVNKNPLFHEGAYGLLVLLTLIKAIRLQKRNGKLIKVPLFHLGCVLYAVGFILWNIDNHFCRQITSFRETYLRPPLPESRLTTIQDTKFPMHGVWDWSAVTQLHGWWHLLAGYATYVHILFGIHNRMIYLNTKCSVVPSYSIGFKVQIDQQNLTSNKNDSKHK